MMGRCAARATFENGREKKKIIYRKMFSRSDDIRRQTAEVA